MMSFGGHSALWLELAGVLEVEVVFGAEGAAKGPAHGRPQRFSGQGGAAERGGAG